MNSFELSSSIDPRTQNDKMIRTQNDIDHMPCKANSENDFCFHSCKFHETILS